MRLSFKQVRDNLESARLARETYFNVKTKQRDFAVGDQVLVRFPQLPRGVNPKFYKTWKGPYRVIKVVGRLNLLVQATPHSKKILIHVDRVRHLTLNDQEVLFDSAKFGKDKEVVDSAEDFREDKSDFSAYIESASDEDAEVDEEDNATGESDSAPVRLTRGAASRAGVMVPDISLPAHCPTSRRGRSTAK